MTDTNQNTQAVDEWDEGEAQQAFEKVSFPTGNYFARIRSIIHCGSVHFEFQGAADERANPALALVIEVHDIQLNEETEEYEVVSENPAIVYDVIKMSQSPKANWTKLKKSLNLTNPATLVGMPVEVEIFTSEKGNMYAKAAKMNKLGLAERKAVPALSGKSHIVASLNKMTTEALEELNMFTQVKDFVLRATNYEGSVAEELVEAIRLEKPEFGAEYVPEGGAAKPKAKPVVDLNDDEEF